MASIFKPVYTRTDPKTGKKVRKRLRKWYFDYRDASGRIRRVAGLRNKEKTRIIALEMEHRALRQRLGLEDDYGAHRNRPLLEHLEEFRAYMQGLGRTSQHCSETFRIVQRAFGGCGFEVWRDISASRLVAYLDTIRTTRSARTYNKHLTAVKQFCRWMVLDSRAPKSPIRHLKKLPQDGRVLIRRALDPKEFLRLILASSRVHGDIYVTAAYTGLRAGEMGALTRDRIDFDKQTLRSGGLSRKRRKAEIMPLHPVVTDRLAWAQDLDPDAHLWPGLWWQRAAEMLRRDLTRAGIEYVTDVGRFDFHALRGQFSTAMIRAGVPLTAAQKLMRHSTPDLTANAYTHLEVEDLRAELTKLEPPA